MGAHRSPARLFHFVGRTELSIALKKLLNLASSSLWSAPTPLQTSRPNGGYLSYRFSDVPGVQPACEENRRLDRFTNLSADSPIVRAPGSSEFLNRRFLISRIEQDRVHVGRDCFRFLDLFFTINVDDLHMEMSGSA